MSKYHLTTFTLTQMPKRFLTSSWRWVRQRNKRENFYHSDFLSSQKFNIFANLSFSSRNWAREFEISLSSLECGEIVFAFPFLFSIGLLHLVNDCNNFNNYWQSWNVSTFLTILGICDYWDTGYNSDNWEPEFMTIFVIWQLRVTAFTILTMFWEKNGWC